MIRVEVPKSAPKGGNLKIVIYVGRQGFTRTETLKGIPKEVYVDPDAIKVEFFTKLQKGKAQWSDVVNLVPF